MKKLLISVAVFAFAIASFAQAPGSFFALHVLKSGFTSCFLY